MNASHRSLPWGVALTLLVPTFAAADEGTRSDSSRQGPRRYTVEEVVVEATRFELPTDNRVATKLLLSNRDTPMSVSVVHASTLERQGAVVLGDALRNTAGAQVHTGFGVFDFFLLRGFDSLSSGLVLIDGVPEPEASFYGLYNVERVEVLKGPAAFLYGGNPLSGAVNLVPKSPLAHSVHRFTAAYGSFNTARLHTDLAWTGDRDSPWSARVNGMWRGSDGYRDGREHTSYAVNPTLSWRSGQDTWARLSVELVDNDYDTDVGLPVVFGALADVPRRRSYQSPFDRSQQTIYRFRLEGEHRLSGGAVVRDKLYLTDFDWPTNGTLFAGVLPDATGRPALSRVLQSLDDRQLFLGNQLEVTDTGSLFGRDHTWLLGVELALQADEFALDVAALPDIDLQMPVETAARPLFVFQSLEGDARSLVAGLYAIDRISLSSRLQLFAGGRADVIDYEDTATDTERSFRQVSPMLGVVYEPLANTSVYLSGGRAFAPPSSLVVGDRDAEESTQIEAGVKRDFGDGAASISVAAYHLQKDNIAIPDASGVTREQGDQRSRGLELEGQARLRPRWFAFATYAYTDAELTGFREQAIVGVTDAFEPIFGVVDRSGQRPAFAPEHTATLWSTREFDLLGVALGGRWVSDQFVSPDNTYRIDSALTFEAALFRQIANGRVRIHFRNLTDVEYETRGFHDARIGATSVIPTDPFSVQVVLDWWL